MSLDRSRPDAELPADKLAEAVEACRKQDRRLDMYYKFASPTARRFVELGFYSNHFGEQTDPALYARCRDAIAPTLTETDILYLLRFESDPGTKRYLNNLLAQLHAPKPEPVSAPKPQAASKPRFPVKRKKPRMRFARKRFDGDHSSGGIFGPKALALLSVVSLVLVIGGISAYVSDRRETEAAQRLPAVDDDIPPPSVARTVPSASRRPSLSRPSPTVQPVTDAPIAVAEEPVVAQTDEEPPTNDAPAVATKPTMKRKLVLTDGTRIQTRPDGTIEVPRTFSYAGAGLKKPFWIYDRQLEKSGRIEHEARAEKTARDKWQALYDEALLTQTESSRP